MKVLFFRRFLFILLLTNIILEIWACSSIYQEFSFWSSPPSVPLNSPPSSTSVSSGGDTWKVEVVSMPSSPIFSYVNGSSEYQQAFNPSWVFPPSTNTLGSVPEGLIVRVQNCSAVPGGPCVYCTGSGKDKASRLVFSQQLNSASSCNAFVPLTQDHVVFSPEEEGGKFYDAEIYGTEDPRVVYVPQYKEYFMYYTAYGKLSPMNITSSDSNKKSYRYLQPTKFSDVPRKSIVLSLATSLNPTNPSGWTRHGAVFPHVSYPTKSATLLILPFDSYSSTPPHYYLFWGDTSIRLVNSSTPFNWETEGEIFISPRPPPFFDSRLVEPGPPPLELSDGNILLIYNAASAISSVYFAGYVILNGTNPRHILYRSPEPFIWPQYPWQHGTYPYTCNVPDVIFVQSARKVPYECRSKKREGNNKEYEEKEKDEFFLYFGAADAVVGYARIRVVLPSENEKKTENDKFNGDDT